MISHGCAINYDYVDVVPTIGELQPLIECGNKICKEVREFYNIESWPYGHVIEKDPAIYSEHDTAYDRRRKAIAYQKNITMKKINHNPSRIYSLLLNEKLRQMIVKYTKSSGC